MWIFYESSTQLILSHMIKQVGSIDKKKNRIVLKEIGNSQLLIVALLDAVSVKPKFETGMEAS